MSKSLPTLQPKAVIMFLISSELRTLSSLAFSTFRILPLSGRTAWRFLSRPCFAEPPAESPSTRKISLSAGSFSEQSASLPGSEVVSRTEVLRVISLALRAASLARWALRHLSMMILACLGFSSRKYVSCSVVLVSTKPFTSAFPSLAFVCPSN